MRLSLRLPTLPRRLFAVLLTATALFVLFSPVRVARAADACWCKYTASHPVAGCRELNWYANDEGGQDCIDFCGSQPNSTYSFTGVSPTQTCDYKFNGTDCAPRNGAADCGEATEKKECWCQYPANDPSVTCRSEVSKIGNFTYGACGTECVNRNAVRKFWGDNGSASYCDVSRTGASCAPKFPSAQGCKACFCTYASDHEVVSCRNETFLLSVGGADHCLAAHTFTPGVKECFPRLKDEGFCDLRAENLCMKPTTGADGFTTCSFCYCQYPAKPEYGQCVGKVLYLRNTSNSSRCADYCKASGFDPWLGDNKDGWGMSSTSRNHPCAYEKKEDGSCHLLPPTKYTKPDCLLPFLEQEKKTGPAIGERGGSAYSIFDPTGYGSVQRVIGRIISQVLGVVGGLVLLSFVYGGFIWMTSAGNLDKVKRGKSTIVWSLIGLVAIFSAYAVLNLILQALGA